MHQLMSDEFYGCLKGIYWKKIHDVNVSKFIQKKNKTNRRVKVKMKFTWVLIFLPKVSDILAEFRIS